MQLLERFRPYPFAAFAAVTLLVWGNRVWLAWTDPKVGLAGKLGYSIPITAFVVAALATLWMLFTDRGRGRRFRALIAVFAVGTVVYWAIRLPIILFRHHPAGFKLVHTLLAVVLAGLAVRAIRFLGQRSGSGVNPRPRNPRAAVNRS